MTNKNNIYVEVLIGVLCCVALFVLGWEMKPADIQEVEVIKYVEVQEQKPFDTSVIEAQWCGGFCDGTVRMVGAWWYADGVVEDEQGQLWGIEQSINTDDFLLLWIADNNTPNNTTDDLIIKVWREAY